MTTSTRQRAHRVVDDFIAFLRVRDLNTDAGWQGEHLIGKLMSFQGFLPSSSGFSGFSKVWEKSLYVRTVSCRQLVAAEIIGRLPPKYALAVICDRHYRGKVFAAPAGGRSVTVKYTDDQICEELGITRENFRWRVSHGYRRLEELLVGEVVA